MAESITALTLLTICRTCMTKEMAEESNNGSSKCIKSLYNTSGMTSIYQTLPALEEYTDQTITILEILQCTTPQLQIEKNDELPKYICEQCLQKIVHIHQFQQTCIRADRKLREMLKITKKIAENSDKIEDPLNYNMIEIDDALINGIKVELDESTKMQSQFGKHPAHNINNIKFEITYSELGRCHNPNDNEWTLQEENIEKEALSPYSNVKDCTIKNREILFCDIRGSTLTSYTSINCHKKMHAKNGNHGTKECDENRQGNTSPTNAIIVVKEEGRVAKKKFTCETCGSCLASRKSLNRHSKIHLRNPKDAKKRTLGQKTVYECTYCTKAFQQSSTLKDHLRVHTGEQPFLCSECGKAFKSLSNMKQHLLRHNSDKRYECPHCPKKFPCLSDLASHKAVHFKNKSHVCDLCGAGFVKPYQLKKHKMYHNGEKPHKCEYCDMRFVLPDHMRRHMRTHTGEKPYKCKYCPRAFAQSNDLIKHLRGHLGDNVYKCELCPQGFRLIKDLRIHFATHKNEDDETRSRNLQALLEEEKKIQIKFGIQLDKFKYIQRDYNIDKPN